MSGSDNEAVAIAKRPGLPSDTVNLAINSLGSHVKAERWLSKPNRSLNGDSPSSRIKKTAKGVNDVKKILFRIEHGISS